MSKYWTLIKTSLARGATYRFTIVAYRVGELLEIAFLIVMWSGIYKSNPTIGGYTLSEMITYVVVGNMVRLLTRNFMEEIIAREIKDGTLSFFLVKPMAYIRYAFVREIGRIVLPGIISVSSQLVVVAILAHRLVVMAHAYNLVIMILMIIGAFMLELLLSFLVGCIAFWTDEVAGLYATIDRMRKFLSGGYFPLSLLPPFYITLSAWMPFAYSFYTPTQLYLGRTSWLQGVYGLGIQAMWIIILWILIKLVWRRGIRRYEGVGI